jgi:simple sugar transport system ATP-binding protein
VQALFAVVKDMQAKGITTMFVSHKLDEVFQIAERVTVLRDGLKVGTYVGQELDDERLTMLMTGKTIDHGGYQTGSGDQDVLLQVEHLSRRGSFRDISFKLHAGDILGITGLLGSGRTELALALFGLYPADGGEIRIVGQPVRIRSAQDAMRQGIGYVPENRLVQGLVMQQAVGKNIVITILNRLLNRLGLVDLHKMQHSVDRWIRDLAIKVHSAEAPVQTLSGGNQQRVVLAKWIANEPRILILDGPTVGIDVAAKRAIHDIVRDLAKTGIGILIISDEISEVVHNCNRVVVMHKGRFVAEYDPAHTSEDEIQACISRAG